MYHLCIVNLVIGTLYCSKGNFEFGITIVIKVRLSRLYGIPYTLAYTPLSFLHPFVCFFEILFLTFFCVYVYIFFDFEKG